MVVIIAALLCGVLAGLGVGSGGIFVVVLRLVGGADQLPAQSLNLIFFVASSIAALLVNIFKKRISWAVVFAVALPGCLTAIGGALIAHEIGSQLLGKLFGGMLAVCGVISLINARKSRDDGG